jgi:hypothetical protein
MPPCLPAHINKKLSPPAIFRTPQRTPQSTLLLFPSFDRCDASNRLNPAVAGLKGSNVKELGGVDRSICPIDRRNRMCVCVCVSATSSVSSWWSPQPQITHKTKGQLAAAPRVHSISQLTGFSLFFLSVEGGTGQSSRPPPSSHSCCRSARAHASPLSLLLLFTTRFTPLLLLKKPPTPPSTQTPVYIYIYIVILNPQSVHHHPSF